MSQQQTPGDDVTPHYQFGWISLFLAWLASHDLNVVPLYAGRRVKHEGMKLATVGMSVFVPAFMAFFTINLLLAPHMPETSWRLAMSCVLALFVFVIDCLIVRTLSATGTAGLMVRVAITVCLGIVTVDPLVNWIYRESIQAETATQLTTERTTREAELNTKLLDLKQQIDASDQKMAQVQLELRQYSPENLAAQRLRERTTRRNDLLSAARAGKLSEITAIENQKDGLHQRRKQIDDEIEGLLVKLAAERQGLRETRRAGEGDVYTHLKDSIVKLRSEAQRINDRLFALDQRIQSLADDRSSELSIDADMDSAGAGTDASTEPTAAEKLEKKRLDAEVTSLAAAMNTLQKRRQQVEAEILRLPQEFAPGTRDDVLAQTLALSKVLARNEVVRWKALALFVLLFMIDLTPIFVKLVATRNYDWYIKTCELNSVATEARKREAAHADLMDAEDALMERMCKSYENSIARLGKLKPEPNASALEKELWNRHGLEERDGLNYRYAETRRMRSGERQKESSLGGAWTSLRMLMWVLKSKLMGGAQ